MFANLNGQEQLQQRKVRFADHNELSEDKSEYDWYSWIDHLISLEFHKAIEELKKEISELEKELEELEDENNKRLKSDTETDLKFIKCLIKHFNNPEEIIKELKSYVDEDKSRASNRMKSHIVLVRYFAEKVQIKMTEETNEFIKGIITQDQNLKTTALAEVSLQSKESFPGDTENDLQGTQPTPVGCKPLKREGTEGLAVPSAGTKIDMNSGQLQTTSYELQNPYDNASMYSALGVAVVGFIAIGVMLCATGNPVLGGVFIAVPVISALILGITKIYEEVSEKKEKKPEIDTLTSLREVLTPQWLSKGRVSNI
ncbi:hypothetical protein [Wolbachia endosymbiont of Protocalliphora sialia]